MDEETRQAFKATQKKLSEIQMDMDGLALQVTRLINQMDQDDNLSERAGKLDREERDQQRRTLHEILESVLDRQKELTARVESMGQSMRDLPTKLLSRVEKEIYKLRIARWESNTQPAPNEPMPLPPPVRGEPTGAHVVPPPDSLALTAGQKKGLWNMAKAIVSHKLMAIPYGAAIWEGARHLLEWIRTMTH